VFLLVEDAQKENPGQFRNILHRPGAVAAPHDIADALDRLIHRLLRDQPFAVSIAVAVLSLCHLLCSVFDEIHDHFGQDVLLFGVAFRDHQRDRDQRVVGDVT